jgi:nucleoporin NUP42
VLASENNHPNRIDICKQNTREGGTNGIFAVKTGFADNPLTSNPTANQNPFSATTQSNPFGGGTSAFGQPSTLGQKPNPFGSTQSSTFGQPSQMGTAAPAFGQASQMGASAPAFGQTSQIGASAPAFGQTSALGQRPNPFAAAAAAPSGFAQVGHSAFGQPSTLGQANNAFGAPSTTNASANPFGQPASLAAASPFAQAAQTAQATTSTTSPFGQAVAPNPFAQATSSNDLSMDTSVPEPTPNNPFGQKPRTDSTFGTQANNPFGAPISGFGPAAFPANGPAPASTSAPAPAQTQPSQALSATGAKPGPYAPGSTKQHPPIESYMTKTMNGQIINFKNLPVVYKWKVGDKLQDQMPPNPTVDQQAPGYRKPDGTWCKILFPVGPPAYNRDTEPDPAQYDANVKAAYARMATTGRFEGGMPEVPPMREDCVWTF